MARPRDIAARFARVNGIKLAYRVHGEGHPLVLIMGYRLNQAAWPESFIEALAIPMSKNTLLVNGGAMPEIGERAEMNKRRFFIGGSDAWIIMGNDEARLIRLWREKRGEAEPEDLSQDLVVQLGSITEKLNRTWYERSSGNAVEDVQRRVRHPVHKWMCATLDGRVRQTETVFEAKFMLPWNFSEEAAAEKHMPQLQHNMWVTASRTAVLSVITGGGKWVEMTVGADPLYQHLLLTAEKKFWRCVESGEPPRLFGIEPPRPQLPAVRTVDMSASNA